MTENEETKLIVQAVITDCNEIEAQLRAGLTQLVSMRHAMEARLRAMQ